MSGDIHLRGKLEFRAQNSAEGGRDGALKSIEVKRKRREDGEASRISYARYEGERKVRALGDASGSRTGVPAALCRPPPRPLVLVLVLSFSFSSRSLPLLSCLPQSEPVSESYDE